MFLGNGFFYRLLQGGKGRVGLQWLLVIFVLLACAGCGGGTGASVTPGQPPSGRTGTAQKGPLILGSLVTAQELNADLSPTGKQYTYQVTSDLGSFTPNSSFTSRYVSLTATGYYFDEVQGAVSSGPITLTALVDLNTDSALNINIMTTLTFQRTKNLMANGKSFHDARTQAEREMLAAFHIADFGEVGDFSALDLSKRREGDKALAAISSLFVQGNSAGNVAQLIANFQADLADNGKIDDATTLAAIATASKAVNPVLVAQNLSFRYRSLGVTFSTSDISAYIDQDGDGIIGKYKFVTNGATPSTNYTSPVYVVGPEDGRSFSATAGTIIVNGKAATSSPVTVNVGDSISISMTSGGSAGAAETAYLNDGNRNVARFTIQNQLKLGTLVDTISSIGTVLDVALSTDGKLLFVATDDSCDGRGNCDPPAGDGGLYIFDVTNPASPVQLSTIAKPAPGSRSVRYDALALSADSRTAFVATGGAVQIFDVSVPGAPSLRSSVGDASRALALSSDGQSAWVIGYPQFYKLDLSDLSSPSIASTIESTLLHNNSYECFLTMSPDGSQLVGAATGYSTYSVEVADLSNDPPSYTSLITKNISNNVLGAKYIGDKTLLVVDRYLITVYNMTNPTAPTVIGSIPSGLAMSMWYFPNNAGISYNPGTKVASIVLGNLLQLVNLSDPAHPVILSTVSLPAERVSVSRDGIAASPDNSAVYVVNNGNVMIFQVGGTTK